MPQCKTCQSHFGTDIWIDGKYHQSRNRKNCYICAPYQQKGFIYNNGIIRHCKICDKNYEASKNNKRLNVCASCAANKNRHRKKSILVEYKGGCCQICGYNKCKSALVFHHIDESTKKFTISGQHCLSLEKLKEEVDKCLLVCHNCHSEIHNKLIDLNYSNFLDENQEIKNITQYYYDKSKKITKEELQQLVWKMPLIHIAKQYSVSDNAVRKWCQKYNIELPKQGYWNNKQYHIEYYI